ncbi:unnamed protein product [Ambrosiozyma monospora]|uniref:Unnamed protein product n=1 Tax=Ambrosiozyma monospora TaxID=43982 RepID=A0A9W6WEL6_AMBMO|nr:unnamed protein product [Ambrosiozyma monospora]
MYDNLTMFSDPLAPTSEQKKLFNVNIGFQQVIENLQRGLNNSLYEKSSYDDYLINEIYMKLKELTNIAERMLSTEMSDFSRSKTANLKVVDNLINHTIESARRRYGDNVSARHSGSLSMKLGINENSEPILTNAVNSMVAQSSGQQLRYNQQTTRRREAKGSHDLEQAEWKRQQGFERDQHKTIYHKRMGIPGYQVIRLSGLTNYKTNRVPPSFRKSSGSFDGGNDNGESNNVL